MLKGLVCAGFFVGLAFGQGTTKPAAHVRVEVIPAKKNFVEGEKPKFYIFLINDGPSTVSIAKNWSVFGLGMSGFNAKVTQLTGKRPMHDCMIAADRFPLQDARSAEQLKKEEYIDLWPGMFVGTAYEFSESECSNGIPHAGTYEISASYITGDAHLHKVSTLDTP